MKHMKRLLACLLTFVMLVGMMVSGGVMTAFAIDGAGTSGTTVYKHGIDISYWNVGGSSLDYSLLDFDKLVASGCEFAILRIGLGSSSNTCSMDKAFKEFYSRARAAGMQLGAYFYSHATTYNQAVNEAKWCISVIESNNMYFEFPIYIDMEESDQTSLGSTAFTNIALGFCDTMTDAGYFSGFYGMHSSQSKLTSAFTSKYDRWTAWVKSSTNGGSQYSWNSKDLSATYGMWQYSWYGQSRYNGIGLAMMDVNICYKDYPAIMQQYGYNNVKGGSTADKLGTYYITAPADDPLNVRDSASTSGAIVDTVEEGDILDVTELSGNWGKFVSPNGSTGWAAIKNYSNYIGVDAQAYDTGAAWGEIGVSVDAKGATTLANSTAEQVAYDFKLPFAIGTATTSYFCIQVVPNSGNGYYFGLTQNGSGYFMMRDCNSGDQLVNETAAPYMTNTETLEINISEWWQSTDYRIDMVRMYIAPQSSVTVNYMYFAANSGVVTSEIYNLRNSATAAVNYTLMDPDTLRVVDATKSGGYTYSNGMLCVTSSEESGYEVAFDLNKSFDLDEVTRWLVSYDSDVRFDVVLTVTTADGDRNFGVCADFWNWVCDAPDGDYLPAMTGSAGLDFESCYTYNNIRPADGVTTVKTVTVRVGGKGTTYINAAQLANSDALVLFYDGVSKSETTPSETPDDNVRPEEPTVLFGDLNFDGAISTTDVRMLLQYLAGVITLEADQLNAADYDQSGVITTADARQMLLVLLG